MAKFRTPRRRLTRQRSGFNVSGDKKGSTCKLLHTDELHPDQGVISVQANKHAIDLPLLFKRQFSIIGIGYYLKANSKCAITGTIKWSHHGQNNSVDLKPEHIETNDWVKLGSLLEISAHRPHSQIKNVIITLTIATKTPISFFGLICDSIKHPFFIDNDVYDAFLEKTSLYIPEILYIDPTISQLPYSTIIGNSKPLKSVPIVCKSCNRCSRFLPIDILNERNTLSFSNHCVSRAPCQHSAFSTYKIEIGSEIKIPKISNGQLVTSHFGHQLECKVCKKFFVNLPLNPLRDSTQHREDSLRRRAFEVLVGKLLERKWIYHIYRLSKGKEFDVAIWEKFDKKCFNCGTLLNTPNDMNLDHTMPLAYLWPLDETATCLCQTCNSSKSDKFPIDFYPQDKIDKLSKITNLPLATLQSRPINRIAVDELCNKIVWFFDDFLSDKDYQKIRKGKKAADLIVHALHNVINSSGPTTDLLDAYKEKTGKYPTTITIHH
ncbi:hypothetical protein M0R36_04325 [bacterium]|jgi:hypothetical protein|nr:hypothetical protein [bacterium]